MFVWHLPCPLYVSGSTEYTAVGSGSLRLSGFPFLVPRFVLSVRFPTTLSAASFHYSILRSTNPCLSSSLSHLYFSFLPHLTHLDLEKLVSSSLSLISLSPLALIPFSFLFHLFRHANQTITFFLTINVRPTSSTNTSYRNHFAFLYHTLVYFPSRSFIQFSHTLCSSPFLHLCNSHFPFPFPHSFRLPPFPRFFPQPPTACNRRSLVTPSA